MRKKNIISVVLSVFLSVLFVAAAVNAATTISTDISTGGTLTVTGASALTGAVTTTAGITSGANIVSDTDSTDNLGATATRWASTFSDNFTGNTITLDGATGVNVITITDSVADGLSIVRGTTDFMVFKTSATPSLTITPNTIITGDLTVTGDDITMTTNTIGALLVGDGTNYNPVVMSSDATIAADGALTIAANAVQGTDISLANEAAGDIMYSDGTNWIRLAKGTANQMLQINAGATAPEWATFAASLGNTLAWTASQKLDAGITVDTDNFIVNGTTGAVTAEAGITLSGATGVNEIVLPTNLADALSIKDSAGDLMVFNTTTGAQTLTITPATIITGALTTSGGIANTGTYTGTSADASSLAVGRLGATTPAFVVDSSTGSQVAGLKVTGAATGGTVAVVAIDSGAATNLTVNAKGAGTIGLGTVSTGAITIGNTSSGATTIYGGSVTNAVRILGTVGTISTEGHGLDVVTTGTFSGGVDDNLVGINSVLTTAGTAGKWASAVYGKVVQGTTQNVTGYLSGGEFEVANTNTTGAMEMFPLVLDSNSSTYSHPDSAYIWGQDFGSADMPNLLKITGNAIGTLSATKMISTYGASEPITHSIKIMIDGVPYWIMMTNVAPN